MNLALNRGPYISSNAYYLFISFFHFGHCLQFHSGEDDAYLELISHSFSLEISIITEPPTEKRLSKKARHLSTHRVLGANRGKKHAYIK